MDREPSFEVETADDADYGDVLLVGLADIGAASLTAIDYLITHLETTQIGHIATRNLPSVTPIEEGIPRRPIRLYRVNGSPIMLLVSEVFVPVTVAERFAAALCDWANRRDIDEIGVLHGTAFPHSEVEHRVFYAATSAFRQTHFGDAGTADIDPLPGGVLDGTAGEVLRSGIGIPQPAIGVFITPAHPPGPDHDAALLLLNAVESCYPIDIDEQELHRRAAETKQYYEELASRLAALKQGEGQPNERDFPEDRMYM